MRLIGLALMTIVAVDCLASMTTLVATPLANGPLTGRPRPADPWKPLVGQAASSRELTMTIGRGVITATYDLHLAADHAIVEQVLGGLAESQPDNFVASVLGRITINHTLFGPNAASLRSDDNLSFRRPQVTVQGSNSGATIHIESEMYRFSSPEIEVRWQSPTSGVHVTTDRLFLTTNHGDVVSGMENLPLESFGKTTVFTSHDGVRPIIFRIRQGTDSLVTTILALGELDVPALGTFLVRLLIAIPTVLICALLQRPDWDRFGWIRPVRAVVAAYSIQLVALGVLQLCTDIWSLAGDYTSPVRRLIFVHPRDLWGPDIAGAYAAVFIAVIILWPLLVLAYPPVDSDGLSDTPDDRPARFGIESAVLGAVGAVAFAALAQRYHMWGELRHPQATVAAVVLLVALIHRLSLALVRTLAHRGLRPLSVASTLVAVSVAFLFPALLFVRDDRLNLVVVVTFLIGGIYLAIWHIVLLGRLRSVVLGREASKAPRRSFYTYGLIGLSVALLVGPILYSLVTRTLTDSGPEAFHVWARWLFGLDDSLGALIGYVLLGALLLLMRSSVSERVPSGPVRVLGIVYALVGFYWSTDRWLYVPIPMLLGWFLIAKVLLPAARLESVEYSTNHPVAAGDVLQTMLAIRRLERSRRRLESALTSKLGKAEIRFGELKERLDPIDAELNIVRSRMALIEARSKRVGDLLGLRSPNDPWEGALQSLKYSLILCIPLVVVYLRGFAASPGVVRGSVVLDFLGGGAWIVLQWVVYGVFFGYFYGYIRGNSGTEKGLWMFITIVVPVTTLWVLSPPIDGWQANAFWVFQVFIFSIVLGLLVGDYQWFRAAKLGWRELLEFKNWQGVVAWVSSIGLALAGSTATLLSSGAAGVLSALLQFGGVIPPGSGPPGSGK